jgi:hypothetical protein
MYNINCHNNSLRKSKLKFISFLKFDLDKVIIANNIVISWKREEKKNDNINQSKYKLSSFVDKEKSLCFRKHKSIRYSGIIDK